MSNLRRSKRIQELTGSTRNKDTSTEDRIVREIRSDLAKLEGKLSSLLTVRPESEVLSQKLSSVKNKVNRVMQFVHANHTNIQRVIGEVDEIRKDHDYIMNFYLTFSSVNERTMSLYEEVCRIHDTLQSMAKGQEQIISKLKSSGEMNEGDEADTNEGDEAEPSSGRERVGSDSCVAKAIDLTGDGHSSVSKSNEPKFLERIMPDNYHPAYETHTKKMESKLASYTKPPEMSIQVYCRVMETMWAEIMNFGGNSSRKDLKRNFIRGLGPIFVDILEDFDAGTLATEWQPLCIHELVPVAKEYLNGISSSHSRKRTHEEMS